MTGVPPVLSVEDLTKRYPKLVALQGVSLRIVEGEIFALLGPNGAGKTTLIGAVCGLVKKTSGRISLFGIDLDADPVSPRYDVGLVPQEINFESFFTVREVLAMQMGYYGRPVDHSRIDEVLRAFALEAKSDQPTRGLSGGMKRRLLIAKALVHRPRLVFLDEPTAGVDVDLRRDLWAYVRRLRNQGTTIVLTTHHVEEAQELADRVGILDNGRLLLVEEKMSLMKRLGERRLDVRFAVRVSSLPAAAGGGTLDEASRSYSFIERHDTRRAVQVLGALYSAGLPVAEVSISPARLEDVMGRVLRGRDT